MRLASVILALGLASGCVTGVKVPLEYTATLNSTLYLQSQIEELEESAPDNTDLQNALKAIAATDLYVQTRYPDLAKTYLELVSTAAGQYSFPVEMTELLETVRLATADGN